ILRRVEWNRPWKQFFETLHTCEGSYNPNLSLICRLHEALEDTYNAHRRGVYDCISIGCFLYLLECFVTLLSSFESASLLQMARLPRCSYNEQVKFQYVDSFSTTPFRAITVCYPCYKHCLHNKEFMTEWIKRSVLVENESYSLLVQRMVAIICLINANFEICLDLLRDLLGRSYITEQLPRQFCETLKSSFQNSNLDKAFMQIDNIW
ncbi:hypothetical protein G4B88_026664, partial [Cannabis sativa]